VDEGIHLKAPARNYWHTLGVAHVIASPEKPAREHGKGVLIARLGSY
jgi:hypothetical protein